MEKDNDKKYMTPICSIIYCAEDCVRTSAQWDDGNDEHIIEDDAWYE